MREGFCIKIYDLYTKVTLNSCFSETKKTMGRFFFMLWPDIIRVGRITSDVIRGMSVTQFIGVGHIAK